MIIWFKWEKLLILVTMTLKLVQPEKIKSIPDRHRDI